MTLSVGRQAPDFNLMSNTREWVSRESLEGKKALVVFIPFPFTGTCTGEVCELRDGLSELNDLDANVVVITCDTIPVNAKWAELESLQFPILSDFWPHGAVAQAFGAFNDQLGCADRWTFALDEQGTITGIFNSEGLGVARNYGDYVEALT